MASPLSSLPETDIGRSLSELQQSGQQRHCIYAEQANVVVKQMINRVPMKEVEQAHPRLFRNSKLRRDIKVLAHSIPSQRITLYEWIHTLMESESEALAVSPESFWEPLTAYEDSRPVLLRFRSGALQSHLACDGNDSTDSGNLASGEDTSTTRDDDVSTAWNDDTSTAVDNDTSSAWNDDVSTAVEDDEFYETLGESPSLSQVPRSNAPATTANENSQTAHQLTTMNSTGVPRAIDNLPHLDIFYLAGFLEQAEEEAKRLRGGGEGMNCRFLFRHLPILCEILKNEENEIHQPLLEMLPHYPFLTKWSRIAGLEPKDRS